MKRKIRAGTAICAALISAASGSVWGQTQVNLRTQSKAVDFSSAGATRPAQTGSALPATCAVGQVFFLTTTTAGGNLMVCASANQWTPSGGGGALAAQANGTELGIASTLNLLPGTYLSQTVSCANGTCAYQPDVDTTRIPTNAAIQSGQLMAAVTTSTSPTTYTAIMSANDPLSAYAANQQLIWNVGATACAGGAMTLNIDGLGAIPLKQSDGVSNLTASQCGVNAQLAITYDGVNSVFRGPTAQGAGGSAGVTSVTATGPLTSTGGATPVISASYQGNGANIQLSTGGFTANDCVKFDANGNTVDAGAACGAGAGPSAVTTTLQPFGTLDNTFGVVTPLSSANVVEYIQFFIPSPGITFSNIKAFEPAGGNTGHQVSGIYNSSCSLVAQSATYTGTGAQQAVAFSIGTTTLTAGSYYYAFSSDSASSAFFLAGSAYNGYVWNFSESAASYRIFTGSNASTTTAGVTTLPATCGTRTALQTPGTHYTPWIVIQ